MRDAGFFPAYPIRRSFRAGFVQKSPDILFPDLLWGEVRIYIGGMAEVRSMGRRTHPAPFSGSPTLPIKKMVTPLPPTLHSTKKMIGPIISGNCRGARTFSSTVTRVSTGASGENEWSP
jgi:hypothetical protein